MKIQTQLAHYILHIMPKHDGDQPVFVYSRAMCSRWAQFSSMHFLRRTFSRANSRVKNILHCYKNIVLRVFYRDKKTWGEGGRSIRLHGRQVWFSIYATHLDLSSNYERNTSALWICTTHIISWHNTWLSMTHVIVGKNNADVTAHWQWPDIGLSNHVRPIWKKKSSSMHWQIRTFWDAKRYKPVTAKGRLGFWARSIRRHQAAFLMVKYSPSTRFTSLLTRWR